jgi:hypothetical protein
MKYQILQANSPEEMEAAVTEDIEKGWVPFGGVIVVDAAGVVGTDGRNVLSFYQAMTHKDEKEEAQDSPQWIGDQK